MARSANFNLPHHTFCRHGQYITILLVVLCLVSRIAVASRVGVGVYSFSLHSLPMADYDSGDNKLYVTGLDPLWEKPQITAFFSTYGKVVDIKILISI